MKEDQLPAVDATFAVVKRKPEKIQAGLELEPLLSPIPALFVTAARFVTGQVEPAPCAT